MITAWLGLSRICLYPLTQFGISYNLEKNWAKAKGGCQRLGVLLLGAASHDRAAFKRIAWPVQRFPERLMRGQNMSNPAPRPSYLGTISLLLFCIRSVSRDARNARSNQARTAQIDREEASALYQLYPKGGRGYFRLRQGAEGGAYPLRYVTTERRGPIGRVASRSRRARLCSCVASCHWTRGASTARWK